MFLPYLSSLPSSNFHILSHFDSLEYRSNDGIELLGIEERESGIIMIDILENNSCWKLVHVAIVFFRQIHQSDDCALVSIMNCSSVRLSQYCPVCQEWLYVVGILHEDGMHIFDMHSNFGTAL